MSEDLILWNYQTFLGCQMPEVPKKLIYVEYVDYWKNRNLALDPEEVRREMANPVTLKSLEQIREENDEFLVVEHFLLPKYDFIFKPAIRIQEIYLSNNEVSKLREQFQKQERIRSEIYQ